MQWSHLTEEKKNNQLAQTEFRFIKNNNLLFFASISALHSSKRRATSTWPLAADQCSGVR
jgi:hypothetical protein